MKYCRKNNYQETAFKTVLKIHTHYLTHAMFCKKDNRLTFKYGFFFNLPKEDLYSWTIQKIFWKKKKHPFLIKINQTSKPTNSHQANNRIKLFQPNKGLWGKSTTTILMMKSSMRFCQYQDRGNACFHSCCSTGGCNKCNKEKNASRLGIKQSNYLYW